MRAYRPGQYSVREYAGCPHCGGPVNVSVELNSALASFASAILPLLPDKSAQRIVDRMALDYASFAKLAEENGDPNLVILRDFVRASKQERHGKKARRSRVLRG